MAENPKNRFFETFNERRKSQKKGKIQIASNNGYKKSYTEDIIERFLPHCRHELQKRFSAENIYGYMNIYNLHVMIFFYYGNYLYIVDMNIGYFLRAITIH